MHKNLRKEKCNSQKVSALMASCLIPLDKNSG